MILFGFFKNRMKLKIGTVHHQLKYKDEEESMNLKNNDNIIDSDGEEANNSSGPAMLDEVFLSPFFAVPHPAKLSTGLNKISSW